MRTWIDVAQLIKTRNLDGGFVVQGTAGLPFLFEEGTQVAFVPPQTDMPRSGTVVSAEQTEGNRGYVRFAEIDDPDTARALVGTHCLMKRSEVPESAAVAGAGIVGWTVRDANEGVLGTVSDIVENAAQNLLEVARPDGGTILIPLVDEFIVAVDEAAREISVEVPAGLTSL